MKRIFLIIVFFGLIPKVNCQTRLYVEDANKLSISLSPSSIPYFINSNYLDDSIIKCTLQLTNNDCVDVRMIGEFDYPIDVPNNPTIKIIGDLNYYYEVEYYDKSFGKWIKMDNSLLYNDINQAANNQDQVNEKILHPHETLKFQINLRRDLHLSHHGLYRIGVNLTLINNNKTVQRIYGNKITVEVR